MQAGDYIPIGLQFAGFQKSVTKKSEFFFSELSVVSFQFNLSKKFSNVDAEKGTLSGM